MKLLLKLFLFSFITLPVFTQAQELPDTGQVVVSKEEIRHHREKQKSMAIFFEANKAKITDNTEKAILLFNECIGEDPLNDAAWYELSMLYYQKKDITKSISCAQKAYEIDPNNTWYAISLASLFSNNNQSEEARKIYELLRDSEPQNPSYSMELANTLLLLDKPQEAIKIYDQLENATGITEELSMRKHQIYLAMGKDKKALEEIEKLAASNEYDSRILSLLAEFYMLQGMKDKALTVYQRILEIDPENPYINISLADFYRQQGDLKKATAALKAGFANPFLDANTKIQVMMTYYSQTGEYNGINEDIDELSRILVEMHPNEPRALSLRGEMLMMTEKWTDAVEIFRKVNELDPGKYQVWENILRIDAIIQDYPKLAEESSQAIGLFPMQPMPYYFNGFANYLLKQYDQSIKSLSTGEKFVVNDNSLMSDFYSLTGDAYHAQNKHDESFAAYETSLRYNSENASVLNNYAYYLSLSGTDLEKAGKMAEKANKLSPDNPSYLDTFAWIFYKQGDFSNALIYIEKAINVEKQPSGIEMEHYGDILYRLDRVTEATEWWKKAQETGEGSVLLESKIKDGKLYE